jgi:hypothetical protein
LPIKSRKSQQVFNKGIGLPHSPANLIKILFLFALKELFQVFPQEVGIIPNCSQWRFKVMGNDIGVLREFCVGFF